jgi:uncharacterized metal-binding protein
MVDLPKKKVGLIACSGEDLACGTVSRVAVRQVLESLRPNDTVTLCLPLFLAGNEQERAFARFYPTITVDGCDKQCAKRATEKYSAKVAGEVVVDELLQEQGIAINPRWRRKLDPGGMQAASVVAERVAETVDQILAHEHAAPTAGAAEPTEAQESPAQATCSCNSDLPVSQIRIGQEMVSVVALEPVFDMLHKQLPPTDDVLGSKLLAAVWVYNPVPAGAEHEWEEALAREYRERFGNERA